jgi:CubicO group peptidase (beta-lactamase class C family)
VASVSKTVTAAGMLRALSDNGVSVDALMHTYLPPGWSKGKNITTITFRELLSHSSGFRGDAETFADIRTRVQEGVELTDKTSDYRNINFTIMRLLIPALNGFDHSAYTSAQLPTALSNAFMAHMVQAVFNPANLVNVSVIPTGSTRTLAYPFPAGTTPGEDFGDWTDRVGGGGFQLSTSDVARFLLKLNDGSILPIATVTDMKNNDWGWNGTATGRHGPARIKGGGFPLPGAPATASWMLNTGAYSYESGAQIAIAVNSQFQSGFDIWAAIDNAHNNSWVPIND